MENITFWMVITAIVLLSPVIGLVVDICNRKKPGYKDEDNLASVGGRFVSILIIFVCFLIMPARYQLVIDSGSNRSWLSSTSIVVAILIFLIAAFAHFVILKEPRHFLGYIAVFAFSYAYLFVTFTNATFDFQEPQTSFTTIENRRVVPRRHSSAHLITVSLDGHESELEIEIPSRVYHSIRDSDMVYVCVSPGLWGFEWVSCIHRVRPDGQVHPNDNAPHLRGLP